MKRQMYMSCWVALCAVMGILGGLVAIGCGGGGGSSPGISAPTAAQIHAAVLAANARGVVPGLSLASVVLPACTNSSGTEMTTGVTYALERKGGSGLTDWLSFDAATRTLSLATGNTAVPATLTAALELTYTCSASATLAASVDFALNDSDGGGVIDGNEYRYSAVPLVGNPPGWIWLTVNDVVLYRSASAAPFRIPTGITKTAVGMNVADAADDASTSDFDGDGVSNADEIAAGTNIFVARSNARFTATSASPIAIGTTPSYISAADFDGDGNLDVTAVLFTDNALRVYLGNGDGTFIQATNSPYGFPVGTSPGALTTGDYNADGRIDIAVAASALNSVWLYFGNGDGTFAFDTNSPFLGLNVGPRGIASGDYDGDGDIDIATANFTSDNYAILLNNGSGTFVVSIGADTVGEEPAFLTEGDFNGNGALDLAIADVNQTAPLLYSLAVLLGNGTGTFGLGSTYRGGLRSWGVTTADVDGDGALDLMLTNYLTNDVSVLLGTGTGAFAESALVTTPTQPSQVAAADFDGDGDIDFATANATNVPAYEARDVAIFLNQGGGTFTQATGSPYQVGHNEQGIAVGDFNNDGILDLAVTSVTDGTMSILLGI